MQVVVVEEEEEKEKKKKKKKKKKTWRKREITGKERSERKFYRKEKLYTTNMIQQQHNVLTSSPTKKWTMARARRSAVGAPHVRTIALARDSKLFNEEVTAIIRPGVLSTELFI